MQINDVWTKQHKRKTHNYLIQAFNKSWNVAYNFRKVAYVHWYIVGEFDYSKININWYTYTVVQHQATNKL